MLKKISFIFIVILVISLTGWWLVTGGGQWLNSQLSRQLSGLTTSLVPNDRLQIIVSILPQQTIVERIGGDQVQVQALIPPGFSPSTYEPTPQEMAAVSRAAVYFRIGYIGFERSQLDQLQQVNPQMLVVDTSRDNRLRMLEAHTHDDEDDDHDHDHQSDEHEEEADDDDHLHQEEIDPHVWLDPTMVAQQAQIIADTLSQLDPAHADDYQANLAELDQELAALDRDLAAAFAKVAGKTMLVYHPAFGYLADRYDFTQQHFQIEGKEPSLQQLRQVVTLAKEENVSVVFVQRQFSTDSAEAIAEQINGVVVPIDPLDPDYFRNLRQLAATISQNL